MIVPIALTFVLLSSAATFLQSLIAQLQTPLGMRPEQTLVAEINLHRERYSDPALQLLFFEALEERLRKVA